MDYVSPGDVVENMIKAGQAKAKLSPKDLIVRGAMAGVFLGYATTLAFTASIQTQMPIIGAILFPVGFVMVILLGLELVTGNFALIPAALLDKKARMSEMLANWFWVLAGHLGGSLLYAWLFVVATTSFGHTPESPMIEQLIKVAESKTLAYKSQGVDGLLTAFIKAILCNWMVALGAIMAMTSKSTVGKIVAMWLPILIFFGQGFEHAVVNMFVIPAGIMAGAQVSLSDWWLWNQIPVLLGNLSSGVLMAGLAFYYTHKVKGPFESEPHVTSTELKIKNG
ncbi:formate/nitrite transporter family protein [Peribacillus sp. SCS-26]|uniref:formate/nitrite transporter family protein n=1 Tax=Paraperibacillus marinus TaxID=3115295 RepID=UPI00390629DB